MKNLINFNQLKQIIETKLNPSQEQKFEIAEIFFSTLTLILIIITIINSPSGGSTLNTIILEIINIIYPFIEAIIHIFTQVNTYLEILTNVILGIFTTLKNILLIIIHNYQMSFMPSLVLCDEGVEYIKVYKEDLCLIKNYYCGGDLLKYLGKSVNSIIRTSDNITFDWPAELRQPFQRYGSFKMRAPFFLSDFNVNYMDAEGFETVQSLTRAWPRCGGIIPIKAVYAREVIEILNANN